MNEILMNGLGTLLVAGILVMVYYYGYCRGDRKRFELMTDSMKRAVEEHWKTAEEAFQAGYKAGRAKKMGVDTAYRAWALGPLKEAIESAWKAPESDIIPMVHKEEKSKSEPGQKTLSATEALFQEPDQRCDDCVHHEYDVDDTDPKTYVMVCKKGKCTTALTCPEFQKKLSTPSDCSKCYHHTIVRNGNITSEYCSLGGSQPDIDYYGNCQKFKERKNGEMQSGGSSWVL